MMTATRPTAPPRLRQTTRILPIAVIMATAGLISACAPTGSLPNASTPQHVAPSTATPDHESDTSMPEPEEDIVGATVRFASEHTVIDVTIDQDSPAVRDFLSLLPLDDLSFTDNEGVEKISYLPRKLNLGDTPGSTVQSGDLIYFAPWGNLGLFYDPNGYPQADQLIHLGTFNATEEELRLLEGGNVHIDVQ